MVKSLKKPPRPLKAADRAKESAGKQPAAQSGPLVITLPAMSVEVVNLILEGLGNMPMARVEQVVNVIRSEAQRQVEAHQQAQQPAPPAAPAPTPAPAAPPAPAA